MNVLKNQNEQYSVAHKKLQIPIKKIWDYIRRYYNFVEYDYGGIINIIKAI